MLPARLSQRLNAQLGAVSRLSRGTRRYHSKHALLDELKLRGLMAQVTRPEILARKLEEKPQAIYLGVDPTADALHIGHLLPLMCLFHFAIRGHRVINVLGGATGTIGDPSGKSTERVPLRREKVGQNAARIGQAIDLFFTNARTFVHKRNKNMDLHGPEIVNNRDWLDDLKFLDFLATYGKFARVNSMLQRESVESRLSSQQGISFTEFTYQLLQGYDFFHLYNHRECTIQLGGSDQWGNICAGLDLIRSSQESEAAQQSREPAFGITTTLLTTSSGRKFGKSEGNAVWLDENLTSTMDFHQHFRRVSDDDAGPHLKMFTLLSLEEIENVMTEHKRAPHQRKAQQLLADEVTEFVHGADAVRRANAARSLLFNNKLQDIRADEIIDAFKGSSMLHFCDRAALIGMSVEKLSVVHGLCKSRSESHSLAKSKGLTFNHQAVNEFSKVTQSSLIDGRIAILRAGKKHIILVLNQQ